MNSQDLTQAIKNANPLISKIELERTLSAIKDHVDYVIGEDAIQDWDDEQCYCRTCNYQPVDSKECICIITNRLKAQQRNRGGAY